jgi:hypothetical protein
MIETFPRTVTAVAAEEDAEREESHETLDPRVLSSVLISLKLSQQDEPAPNPEDPHSQLLELMHSSPVRALLDTAALFAQRQGLAPHEALQQILGTLQEIDKLWNTVLMKEGLARLSSQYH